MNVAILLQPLRNACKPTPDQVLTYKLLSKLMEFREPEHLHFTFRLSTAYMTSLFLRKLHLQANHNCGLSPRLSIS